MNGIALRFAQTLSSISRFLFSSPFRKWRICQWPIVEASLSLKQQTIFSVLFSSYNFYFPFSSFPSLSLLGHYFPFLFSLFLFTFISHLLIFDGITMKTTFKTKGHVHDRASSCVSMACTLLRC